MENCSGGRDVSVTVFCDKVSGLVIPVVLFDSHETKAFQMLSLIFKVSSGPISKEKGASHFFVETTLLNLVALAANAFLECNDDFIAGFVRVVPRQNDFFRVSLSKNVIALTHEAKDAFAVIECRHRVFSLQMVLLVIFVRNSSIMIFIFPNIFQFQKALHR